MYKITRPHIYLIVLTALFIHLTILRHIKIFGARPDILLLFVIFFGLFLGPARGLESGLVAGFLEDIFTVDIFWVNTLIFGTVGFLAGVLKMKFYKESKMTQLLLVFAVTIVAMSLRYMAASLLIQYIRTSFSEYFFSSIIPVSIYTCLVSIPIFSKFIAIYNLREEDEDLL